VLSIADGVNPGASQNFGYDVMDRLTAARGSYGSLSYTYDGVDNRVTQGLEGAATAYAYTARSNQLASIGAGDSRQTISHTKAGNVESVTPASGAPTGFRYTQAGRLAAVTRGTDPLAQYTYDGFGRRVMKVGAVTATTLYQYDRSGRLLEESDGGGNPQVDYIYLDGLPVATLSPQTGQVYCLHLDRLGTPQIATDANQGIVWTASYGPFGEMSAVPALIVQNLRLPGQEFDADTGLYHNGFRDYAPAWGRYVQTDPCGDCWRAEHICVCPGESDSSIRSIRLGSLRGDLEARVCRRQSSSYVLRQFRGISASDGLGESDVRSAVESGLGIRWWRQRAPCEAVRVSARL
jgi:RHS repeat-associated protein